MAVELAWASRCLAHCPFDLIVRGRLDTLVTVLSESGVVNRERLQTIWRERYREETATIDAKARRGELSESVLEVYRGDERELFTRLVREGFAYFAEGKTVSGARELERAAARLKIQLQSEKNYRWMQARWAATA